ncbi:pyridoxal phosphate-dependent aminotransferase [Candidatus Woesebacteria bacterium]|nr:pyridoxal phosphate-dependent aminotransferase [Candidatus Woesebacteria bacterium]
MLSITPNSLIADLPASPTLSLGKRIKDLQKQQKDIINLTVGEPEFATPELVKQAAIAAINAQDLRYPPSNGIPELRTAVAQKLQKENNLDYSPDDIVIGVGSKHLLHLALQVVTNPGDEVLIPVPGWGTYDTQVRLVGAIPVLAVMTAPFVVTAQLLQEHLSPKTKVVILNSPSNPTGALIPQEELFKIADFAVQNKLIIIADEIYEHLLFRGRHVSIASLNEEIKAQTITINGVSKAYAMTGWRLGYAAGPSNCMKLMSSVISQTTSGNDVIVQHAAIAALQLPPDFAKINTRYQRRIAYFKDRCQQCPGVTIFEPDGGLYIWCKVDIADGDSNQLCEQLVDHHGVAIVPGEAFHTPGYVRIGLGASDEVFNEGVSRLRKGFASLVS